MIVKYMENQNRWLLDFVFAQNVDGRITNLIGIHTSSVQNVGVVNTLRRVSMSRKEMKKELEWFVMMILIVFFLVITFCMINIISIRFVLYLILTLYSSVKITNYLVGRRPRNIAE